MMTYKTAKPEQYVQALLYRIRNYFYFLANFSLIRAFLPESSRK